MARFLRHVADVVKFLWKGDTGLREQIQRMNAERAKLQAQNLLQEAQMETRALQDLRRAVEKMKEFHHSLDETEEAARALADGLFSQAERRLKNEYLTAEQGLEQLRSGSSSGDARLEQLRSGQGLEQLPSDSSGGGVANGPPEKDSSARTGNDAYFENADQQNAVRTPQDQKGS